MKRSEKIILGLVILLVIAQASTAYLLYSSNQKNSQLLDDTQTQITSLNQDLQGKINTLTDSISALSSDQVTLQGQISELKATTSADFSGIIDTEIQGVVTIKTDLSQGTGFLITDDGYVVTNYHVMEGARRAGVYTYDSQQHQVTLVGYDANMDIALLKITGQFHELEFGNSDDVKIGEKVIAIGNPFGLSFTATEGIISAKDRPGINNLPYYLQTDTPINPGNSGGPLINTKGKVIGINNFKITDAENLGFALEINYAKETINSIALEKLNQTIV